MRFFSFILAGCMIFIASQQARADYTSDWTVVGQEYQLAGLYQYNLQLVMDAAEARGDHKAFKEARKAFKKFHKSVFKELEHAYGKALKGSYVWIPTRYWNWNVGVSFQMWKNWTPSSFAWSPWAATAPSGWLPGASWNYWVPNTTTTGPTTTVYYVINYGPGTFTTWTPGGPVYGTQCTSDVSPCLKCVNGFLVPDNGANPGKRCYRCVAGGGVPADGHPCNDYNPNTTNDRCNQGVCKGTQIIPPSPSAPQDF